MTPIQRQNAENRALLAQRQQNYTQGAPMLYSSGTQEEREKEMSGLETARVGYGQNLFEIGADVNRVRNLQRERTEGSDPISEAIRNQKAGATASASRNLASSGVKGGAAAGAVDSIARTRDADIAASLYGQQANNIAAERSLASNMLAGTTALAKGEKAEGTAINLPNAPTQSGFLGTVICTELYRQGLMSVELYEKDSAYGMDLLCSDYTVVKGYQLWARPLANAMSKSPLLTSIIAPLALKWAKHIAGEEKSLFGSLCVSIGEPLCGIIGKLSNKLGVSYVK